MRMVQDSWQDLVKIVQELQPELAIVEMRQGVNGYEGKYTLDHPHLVFTEPHEPDSHHEIMVFDCKEPGCLVVIAADGEQVVCHDEQEFRKAVKEAIEWESLDEPDEVGESGEPCGIDDDDEPDGDEEVPG